MAYEIDARSSVPYYQQLAALLRAEIESGGIAPDDPLPSLATLVQETGMNIKTVQKAIDVLRSEKLAYMVPGRGAYVTPPHLREQD